jgi:hypothetical protein
VKDGKIRRRTMTIAAPQQRHSSCGRGVGVQDVPEVLGCLNTSKRSSAINRLLLGCKKP